MINNLQALRAIAALLVVFFHLMHLEPRLSTAPPVLPEWFLAGTGGVDLFFVISGFIMVWVTKGYTPGFAAGTDFLYKRATRIYPLYWIYSIVLLVLYFLQPNTLATLKENRVDLLASFLLIPDAAQPLLNVGWTLRHELYFYVVFTVILFCIRERHMLIFLIAWAAVIAAVDLSGWSNGPTAEIVFSPYTFEFIAGSLVALAAERRQIYLPRVVAIAGILLACIPVIIFITNESFARGVFGQPWWRVLLFGLPGALLVYGMVGIELSGGWIAKKWLVAVGNASYSLYLAHFIVFLIFAKLWRMAGLDPGSYHMLFLSGLLVSAVVWCIVSYRFIEKPLLNRARDFWKRYRSKNRPQNAIRRVS